MISGFLRYTKKLFIHNTYNNSYKQSSYKEFDINEKNNISIKCLQIYIRAEAQVTNLSD